MSLSINTDISALFARNTLNKSSQAQKNALQRLSSGLKINNGSDNPAGLVISEYLRSQLGGIERASRNTQEAYNTLAIAEGGLSEMSSSLTKMRELAIASLNSGVTSSGQTSANQAELNGLISAFGNIAATTSFGSQKLLDGSQEITFTANDPAAILASGTQVSAYASGSSPVNISYAGGASAQAEKAYVESATAAGGTLAQDTEFTVTGAQGAQTFSFAAGTALSDVATAVNNAADSTGVNAYAINGGTQLRLASTDYGSSASVRVDQRQGDLFAQAGRTVTDAGQNATVTVAGQKVTSDGLVLNVSGASLNANIKFSAGDTANTTIAQTGYDQDTLTNATTARTAQLENLKGGMQFQLGEGAGAQNRTTFGLASAAPGSVGQVTIDGNTYTLNDLLSGGSASLANNPEAALAVIDQAIADISGQRGSIGAFQSNTLQTNINSLSVAAENVTATESGLRDANVAEEMTNFIRATLLEQIGAMNTQAANVNASNVLKLLGA